MQKLLIFFQQKYWHILDVNVRNFNETVTNDVISFEQPGPANYFQLMISGTLLTIKKCSLCTFPILLIRARLFKTNDVIS